ncbi:DYNEIN LIGHT CHAIN [Salix koriyanagi]|uniref:DYNEIN LIGHT CHAIN n=1 Tax=Salix koriyanagi TaxID=2511006 RepID=A0A9Q0WZQ6_9ROSI|nr:DYNEIN LIGHT CHAIN [Salix koriyanagi]
MLQTMQEDALDLAAKSLDFFDAADSTDIARFIKKEFDRIRVAMNCGERFWGSAGYPEPEENQFEALESLETLETMEA